MYIKCINSKDKYLTFLKFILVATILFLLLIFSKNNFEEVKSSINIFINSIFPSLFPFILFSELIISSGLIDTLNQYLSFLITKIFSKGFASSGVNTLFIVPQKNNLYLYLFKNYVNLFQLLLITAIQYL